MEVSVGSEVPHRQLSEKLVLIGSGIGFLPKSFIQGFPILLVESLANVPGYSVLPDVMGELMHADVPSFITILIEFQKIFLTAGSEQAPEPSCPLIDRQPVILL